jgi:hypothetical protein
MIELADIQLVQALAQMGAAGVLILAGWRFMEFLRQERQDRGTERDNWRKDIKEIHLSAQTERDQWRATIDAFSENMLRHDLMTAEAHKQAAHNQEQTSIVLSELSKVVAGFPCVNGHNPQPAKDRSKS